MFDIGINWSVRINIISWYESGDESDFGVDDDDYDEDEDDD